MTDQRGNRTFNRSGVRVVPANDRVTGFVRGEPAGEILDVTKAYATAAPSYPGCQSGAHFVQLAGFSEEMEFPAEMLRGVNEG